MTDHEAYVAFNMVPDVGSVKVAELAQRHGSVAAAWEAFDAKVDWKGGPVDWKGEIARARRMHVTIVTRDDPRYPASLDDLPSKPIAMYVSGNPSALSMPSIAIVGTRLPTLYGMDMAGWFAGGIAKGGLCVVSGLATGIDAEAHKGALAVGGTTVGILGGALDRFFPEENRGLARRIVAAGGAVASEYPFGFPPGKKTFPQRNRVVAALARGVLAVESPVQSGTLITCSFAKKLGRHLMAVPANLDSKSSAGCWNLIREGASMVLSPDDVLRLCSDGDASAVKLPADRKRERAIEAPKKPAVAAMGKQQLTLEEAAVLRAIPSTGITLDRLAFNTKLPASAVGDAAMSLRLKRLVRFMPGNRVAPAAHS